MLRRTDAGWRLVTRGSLKQPVGPAWTFDRKLAGGGEWGRMPSLEVVMRPPEVCVRSLSGGGQAQADVDPG
jgi:hypothetical protein